MNKPSLPPTARLLDMKAIEALKEVATEFAVFNSAASDKVGPRGDPSSILTSVVAEAVDRPHADVAPGAKPQQRADAFAAHIVWLSEAALLPGRGYLLKAGGQTIGAMVTAWLVSVAKVLLTVSTACPEPFVEMLVIS